MRADTLEFIKKNFSAVVDYMNSGGRVTEYYSVSENQFIYAIEKINAGHPLKIKFDSMILDYAYVLPHVSSQTMLLSKMDDPHQSLAVSNYLRDEITAYINEAVIAEMIGIKFRNMTEYQNYIARAGQYRVSLDRNTSNSIVRQNTLMILGFTVQRILGDTMSVSDIRDLTDFINFQSTKSNDRRTKTLYF